MGVCDAGGLGEYSCTHGGKDGVEAEGGGASSSEEDGRKRA